MKFKTGIFPFVFPKHIFAEIVEGDVVSKAIFGYMTYEYFRKVPGEVINGEISYFDIEKQKKIRRLAFSFFFFFIGVQFDKQKQL